MNLDLENHLKQVKINSIQEYIIFTQNQIIELYAEFFSTGDFSILKSIKTKDQLKLIQHFQDKIKLSNQEIKNLQGE